MVTALAGLLGESPAIAAVRDQVARLLRSPAAARRPPSVLILGETGTGKGLLAEAMHRASGRAAGPFVDVNCAAIPETMLEAELFGFERGAFTDARQAKPGLFQVANGGTLFLDEIGLLPLGLQSKLLRVVEERAVRRLGGTRNEPLDVWIIGATSEDLAAAVGTRRFRQDLYHRLAVVTFRMPPLRERGEDMLRLAEHFLARACEEYRLAPKTLAPEARASLRAYPWPGNVRELANVMERAALLADARTLTPEMLGLPDAPGPATRSTAPETGAGQERGELAREPVLEALRATAWNISRAAKRLGVPRNTLRYRMEKLDLPEPRAAAARRRGGRPPTASPAATPPPLMPWETRRVALLHVSVVRGGPHAAEPTTNRALEAVVDKVRSFGGVVESVGAGHVVAVFGLEPAEDALRRAATAAMAIRTFAARARAEDPLRPDATLALHVEALPLARVGDGVRVDEPARRVAAATLETLARRVGAGEIAVSTAAATALARTFVLQALPAAAGAARLVGHADPALSRFVGRERELALLLERFELARGGQGQVVVLVGEPGIGKSRLLLELRRRLGADIAWLEGQAMPFGRSMPFHPVIAMLRRSYRIDDADPDRVVAEKLEEGVLRLGEDLRGTLPFLRDLLALDPGDPAVAAMDPKRRHAEIVTATHRLLERAAERRPHVLVLEDGHWMDGATEHWLRLLADRVAAKAVLVILTCRPGYAPPFGDHSYHTRLALSALSAHESAELAQAVLGVDDVPATVRDLMAKKAEGNPFFVEELLKSLEEAGTVARDGPRLVVVRSLDTVEVPDTIQDVILARIGRLRPEAREALQRASAVGREFTRRLLERLVDAPETLDELLGELKAVELVYEKALFPEHAYVFKHGLIHLVAYGTLAPERRRELHRRIGGVVEELYADRLAEHYGLLAHHFVAGEDWPRALDYLLKAADRAARTSAIQAAIALYDDALQAARHQPGAASDAAAMTIHQAKAALYFVVSDFAQSRAEAERLLELARGAGDRAREAAALAAIAWAATWARDLDGAISVAEQAIAVASAIPADAVLAGGHFTIGFVSAVTGNLDAGREHLGRAVSRARLAGDSMHHSLALSASGLVKSWEGDFGAGAALQGEAVAIARQHDLVLPLLFGLFVHGLTLTALGDYDGALGGLREGVALSERIGDEAIHHRLLNCLGWLHMELGDLDGALTLNQRSAEVARRRKDPGTIPNAEINLGDVFVARGDLPLAQELYEGITRYAAEPSTSAWMRFRYTIRLAASQGALCLARGDVDGARRHAEQCLEAATRTSSRKNLVKGWRLTGEIAQAQRRWDDAEPALRRALALAEAIGNPPQLWLTHLALARLAQARGRTDDARREAARGQAVVASVLARLQDTPLRASLERAAAVRELRSLAGG